MTTGRRLIETALREPMTVAGWSARRAGWFTVPVVPGSSSGSLAVMTAVEHHAAGSAGVNWVAGFRDEAVEAEVAALLSAVPAGSRPSPAYTERTVVTTASPGMTGRGFLSWTVDPGSAAAVAADMVHAADQLVVPWLHRLAQDRSALAAAAFPSRRTGTRNLARAVLLARDVGDGDGVRQLIEEAEATAVGDNPAHAAMRAGIAVLRSAVGP